MIRFAVALGILGTAAVAVRPAQAQEFERYQLPPDLKAPQVERLSNATKETEKRIKYSLKEFEKRQEVGEKAGKLIKQHGKERTITVAGKTFEEMPAENPLDKNGGWESQWQEEYTTKDSKQVILNDETFLSCFEERFVDDKLYQNECALRCANDPGRTGLAEDADEIDQTLGRLGLCVQCEELPPFIPCVPIRNHFYVSESYFPVYQVAANKSGSRSIKVDAFPGTDGKPEFLRNATKQRYDSLGKQLVEQAFSQLGLTGGEPIKWPDWHKPSEKEFFLQKNEQGMMGNGDPQEYYSTTYQTNVHAQSTRDRPKGIPRVWGYEWEDKCAFSTLDDPSKDIVLNASDGTRDYMFASMAAEFTRNVNQEAYRATVLDAQGDYRKAGKTETLPQKLEHSQRRGKWSPFTDLKDVGVQSADLKRDWVFYGHTLAPFNVTRYDSWMDPVYAGISLATSQYYLAGLEQLNQRKTRALKLTWWKEREGEGRKGYTGEDPVVKEPIVFTDKIQLAFPPIKDSGNRRGSYCFRPENLGRFAPGESESRMAKTTSSGHFNIPMDLRTKFPEVGMSAHNFANEVRIVVYEKRINCHCEYCSRPWVSGCSVLNDGDEKEGYFVGKQTFPKGWKPQQGAP